MTGPITREQYMKAYKDAPEIVRAVYDADLTVQIIVELQTKYKLHVDNAGLLGQGVGHMLLGLVNPQEFLNELLVAKIPDKDAREIMTEINQKIFVPLREQMEKGSMAVTTPAQGVAPSAAPDTSVIPRLVIPTVSSVPPSNFQLRNKIVHPPLPVPPPRPAMIATPKPMDSSTLLEDHEESHIEFKKVPVPPVPPRIMPSLLTVPVPPRATPPLTSAVGLPPRTVSPPQSTTPRTMTPPPNLPGALHPPEALVVPTVASGEGRGGGGILPHIIPAGGRPELIAPKTESPVAPPPVTAVPGAMQPKPITPVAPAPQASSTPPPPKAYSSDPYREPIEP